ncbi:MAG: hypothetical protein J5818_06630, partial [Eggerthellaceae bacterium]|nr:hypothetical protein [Eggerthellaceae bacterium]
VVLAALGTQSMLGWGIATHWMMGGTNTMALLGSMVTKTSTWIVIAGWLVAALVQSLLSMQRRRWMEIVGLVLGVAIVAAVLVYALGPSLQVVIPIVVGFAVLLAVMV